MDIYQRPRVVIEWFLVIEKMRIKLSNFLVGLPDDRSFLFSG